MVDLSRLAYRCTDKCSGKIGKDVMRCDVMSATQLAGQADTSDARDQVFTEVHQRVERLVE